MFQLNCIASEQVSNLGKVIKQTVNNISILTLTVI